MSICSICHGGCCRALNVNLTGYDIVRIINALEIRIENFVAFHEIDTSSVENIEKLTRNFVLLKFADLKPDKFYRPCLKLVQSKIIPGTVKCLFLQEWDKTILNNKKEEEIIARCGIYSVRPLACAVYPSSLDETGLIGLTTDPNLISYPVEHSAYNLCPRPINDKDFSDGSGVNIHNLVINKYELAYFRSIADLWNNSNRNFADFTKYLQAAYANRVVFCNPEDVIVKE